MTTVIDAPPQAAPLRRGRPGGRAMLALLVVGLVCTGASGLVYQQLWLRQLSLIFGVTVEAAAVALAAFMAGLALGSWWAGRFADRTGVPLRWYGVSEITVGVAALATPAAMALVERAFVGGADVLGRGLPLDVLRLVLSFGTLVVPATLMGASTPLVITAAVRRGGTLGQRTGALYAANTAGAIVGCVLAGYVLIGSAGILGSFRIAAAVNLVVGVVMVVVSWRAERPALRSASAEPPAAVSVHHGAPVHRRQRQVVLVVFGISGFCALALEVVWFRLLLGFLPSSVYAFTAMLATVLIGIAAGSAAVTPFLGRRVDWWRVLVLVEAGIGLAALASLWLVGSAYDVVDRVGSWLPRGGFETHLSFVASALAIFPATFLMGVAFPVGVHLYAGREHQGADVGRFYAVNTASAIVGSLAAGFVLVPWLGTRGSALLLCGVLVASAALLAWVRAGAAPRERVRWAGALGVAFLVVAATAPDPWGAALAERYPGETVVFQEEGVQSTVSVHDRASGRVMYLDGLQQASTEGPVVQLHRLIGALPMALHPDPREALVIGLGGGVTAGAVGAFVDTDVRVVELAPEVVRAARYFDDVNQGVLDRPNVTMVRDDGRNDLLLDDRTYDVITADIIQPEHAGAGKVWSVEYWELVRSRLDEGGIAMQWIGEFRSEAEYKLILRSFLEVFPEATLWADGRLMVGCEDDLRLDPAAFADKLDDPDAAAALAAAGITSFDGLLELYTAGPEELQAFAGPGPVLTDDLPRIEYWRSLGSDREGVVDLSGLSGDAEAELLGGA